MSTTKLYVTTAVSVLFFGAIFGLVALVVVDVPDPRVRLLAGLGAVVFVVLVHAVRFLRMKRMLEQNYAWYVGRHPDRVKGKRVECHACGADSIRVRGLMQRTFMREHFCGRCGEVLYYSPERR